MRAVLRLRSLSGALLAAFFAVAATTPAVARDGVRSWHGGANWSHGGPPAARPGGAPGWHGAPPPGVHGGWAGRPGWAPGGRPGWGAPHPGYAWRPAPVWRPPAYYGYAYPRYGYGWVVPVLPVAAATVWIGGAPYYQSGGVWYSPVPGGYQVVQPPLDYNVPPGPPDPSITPRAGQSPQQTEADIQDCNRLAALEPHAQADAQEFQRQVAACLNGRGYTLAGQPEAPQSSQLAP